ncbi:MAG: amino acid ABC transporter ATP-binding protein [Lachnospiraceae bacterium]|nr:amino acid ABC transporter ATP-binding protein [Lachnospiraceae bacterium]
MIEIKGIKKRFRNNEVLKGVDLTVEEGQTVSLIGSSGSGKSTLLRCINLLETPDEGKISIADLSFDAKEINRNVRAKARRRTAMVFQNFGLFENKTALENIMEALIVVQKKTPAEALEIGLDYIERVGMEDHRNHYPQALSGGQKQRIAIARALALDPKIILFDEPTSALDPELVQEVLNVIKKVSNERTTMLIVTHEMDFARDISDKVAFMSEGQILEIGTPQELFGNPKEERTRQFLDRYLQRFTYVI